MMKRCVVGDTLCRFFSRAFNAISQNWHDTTKCDLAEYLRLVDSRLFKKVLLTASHICFHQKSTTLAYVLQVTVIHSLYVQITYVNPLLSPDAYFVFSDY